MSRFLLSIGIAAAIAFVPVAVSAQSDPHSGDFTFRRVGLPQAGANRITVQADPPTLAVAAPKPEEPSPEPEMAGRNHADWFWRAVSPDLGEEPFARAVSAIEHMADSAEGRGVGRPRLQFLQNIAANYGISILSETLGTQVSPAFVVAVIATESAGRPDAVSHAGAQGLMQLMPGTAERFGVTDSFDPHQNIRGGVAYLDWLMTEFDGDPILALAAYNAGENAVKRAGGVPDYEETRNYVPKVLAAWSVARGLCVTPPDFLDDGCVFAVTGG